MRQNREDIERIFNKFDENQDGYISKGELKMLLINIDFGTYLDSNETYYDRMTEEVL